VNTLFGARDTLRAALPDLVLASLESGPAIVTLTLGGKSFAAPVTSVSVVGRTSTLLLAVAEDEPLAAVVGEVTALGLNLLGGDEFLLRQLREAPDLDGIRVVAGDSGVPLLVDSAAQIEGLLVDAMRLAGQLVCAVEVATVHSSPDRMNGGRRGHTASLEAARDESVYVALRDALLGRDLPLGDVVDIDEVADRLNVRSVHVGYALARLAQDGLVVRGADGRYAVTPVDEALVTSVLHARRILMTGIAECLVHELTDSEVAQIREAAERTRRPPGTRNIGVENGDSVRVFKDFNETVVRLSGNEVLSETYARLSVPTVMGHVVWQLDWSHLHDLLSAAALTFADAIEARDRRCAVLAVRDFNTLVEDYMVGVIRQRGGRL
jgi:DNA-binding GntR family transcriptional regulator